MADGIYHLGFEMRWGRLLNEDGKTNASILDVASWLDRLLAEDLAKGTLANPNIAPNLPAIATTVVYAFAGPVGLGRVA